MGCVGTPEKPGDLGYWVGYCIAKSHYDRAEDKRVAMKTLLELKDLKKILAESGWKPGASDSPRLRCGSATTSSLATTRSV